MPPVPRVIIIVSLPLHLIIIVSLHPHFCPAREVLAANTSHIFVEFSHRVIHLFEMTDLQSCNFLDSGRVRRMDAIVRTPVESLMLGQCGRCLASIANLSSVPTSRPAVVLGEVVPCEFQDLVFIDLQCATLTLPELSEIGGPDLHRLLKLERWIVQLRVDPGHESFIQNPNAICSQEQDASVELEDAQEH